MKQHIGYIQLEELTNDQRKKLKVWWYGRPEYDPPFEFQQTMLKYEQRFKQPCLPAPSEITIGQMIEFLATHNIDWEDICTEYPANDLCDALWEAVKEVLNK